MKKILLANKKTIIAIAIALALIAAVFAVLHFSNAVPGEDVPSQAVSEAGEAAEPEYTDFFGKKFAVKTGTIYDAASVEIMNASETLFFDDYSSIYEAIQRGLADATMRGYYTAYTSIFDPSNSGLAIIKMPEGLLDLSIGAMSMDQGVIDAFNSFLADIKADGTYNEMVSRWIESPPDTYAMPEIPLTGENGTLVVATSSDYIPYSFLGENGVHMGFDMELARRFAAYSGKDIEVVDMAFSGILPYIVAGKADIAISEIVITEERKKSVLFTDVYLTDYSAIIYRRSDAAFAEENSSQSIAQWLRTGIERNLITENRWKLITDGLWVTITITFAAQLFGTVVGAVVCFVLTRKKRPARMLGDFFCTIVNGTPVVVLLMITYYIIFGNSTISNVLVAVAAFTFVVGAGVAQTLKGAIDTVDPVEIEAARSLGFSAVRAFWTVTLPQAARRAMPAYTKSFVELMKSTAIVGYIAIQDLTRAGDIIRSRTYDAYFPLLLVALIYLAVTTLCVQIFKVIIKRLNSY